MIVTRYVARHDGLEIIRGEDPGEVLAFAREHLRQLFSDRPVGAWLRTTVGEHVIHMWVVGPDDGLLTTPVIVPARFRRVAPWLTSTIEGRPEFRRG